MCFHTNSITNLWKKPVHETYVKSFPYVQMYEFLMFHAYFIIFHGQKTSSDTYIGSLTFNTNFLSSCKQLIMF